MSGPLEVARPPIRSVRLKMKNGNGAGGCSMKRPIKYRRKFSKRPRPLMRKWKNDELERLHTDRLLLWVHTPTRLPGLLEMAPHGAVDLVMLVSHSRPSGRGRDRLEARTRVGVRSACSPRILSKKKRRRKKRKTRSATARMSPRRVRMPQTTMLIAVRSLWFAANRRDRYSSSHLFLQPLRGLQCSKWMPRLRVFLHRHLQQAATSISL